MNEPKWNDNDRETLRRKVEYYKSKNPSYTPWKRIGQTFNPPRDGDSCKRMYIRIKSYPQSNPCSHKSLPPKKRPIHPIRHETEIEKHIHTHLSNAITSNPNIGVHSEVQNSLAELQRAYDDLCDTIRKQFYNMKNEVVMNIAKRRLAGM